MVPVHRLLPDGAGQAEDERYHRDEHEDTAGRAGQCQAGGGPEASQDGKPEADGVELSRRHHHTEIQASVRCICRLAVGSVSGEPPEDS